MSAGTRLAAALLTFLLAWWLAPYAVVIAAVLVIAFGLTCAGLGWLLASTRHTWGSAALARKAGTP